MNLDFFPSSFIVASHAAGFGPYRCGSGFGPYRCGSGFGPYRCGWSQPPDPGAPGLRRGKGLSGPTSTGFVATPLALTWIAAAAPVLQGGCPPAQPASLPACARGAGISPCTDPALAAHLTWRSCWTACRTRSSWPGSRDGVDSSWSKSRSTARGGPDPRTESTWGTKLTDQWTTRTRT